MGKGLYLFVDQSFAITLNLILNRHQLLSPLREESNRCNLKAFMPRPPEKQCSCTDGTTVPELIEMKKNEMGYPAHGFSN